MVRSLTSQDGCVSLRVLSEDQIRKIQAAALDVLAETGCRVFHSGARQMLKQAGALVVDDRVYIPRDIVEACIRSAPKGMLIYDRNGQPAMNVVGRNSYYGTSTASPRTRDPLTGEIRETRVADIALGALVSDALPNIDWVMPMGSCQDVPALAADVYEFQAVVTNTIKPIVFIGYSPRGVELVYEMAAEVAGGMDNLRARPFLLAYPEPISPLIFPAEVVERMFIAADLGMPQIPASACQPGANCPVTLAGTVAQFVAEALVGLVLVQLRKPGAPCFLGGNIGVLDMATTHMSIAAPEMSLGLAAYAEVAQALGLPTWGLAGSTDAKLLDAQAGIESTFSILSQGLAGLNLIHDVGYLDMGMVCSAEMLVMGDEVIGMSRRFMRGIEVNEETLARAAIQRAGPGGHHLDDDHTVRWFRKELWMPKLLTRKDYVTWEQEGSKDMSQKVSERVRKIIDSHKVESLPDQTLARLQAIVQRREEELAAQPA